MKFGAPFLGAYSLQDPIFIRDYVQTVEDYTLTSVLNYARAQNFGRVVLRFREGPKNEQMRTILSNNNFIESAVDGDFIVYGFDLKQQQIKPYPKWFSPFQQDIEKAPILSA